MSIDNASSSASKPSFWDLVVSLVFESQNGRWEVKWSFYQAVAILVGIAMLLLYSYSSAHGLQSLAICLLTAGASLAMGILVGFLFGIPRAAQTGSVKTDAGVKPAADEKPAADPKLAAEVKPAAADATLDANVKAAPDAKAAAAIGGNRQGIGSYSANTNLEQISDWLTKIIVGVGLVQLTVIPGKLKNLADYLAGAFGPSGTPGVPAVPSALVMTIIFYFAIFGFLLGYLWARIYLMEEFQELG